MSNGAGGRHRDGRPSPTPAASFRILFPSAKVGAVIGKAGKFVKPIHRDTGAAVLVADASPGSGDSVITVSGPRFPMGTIQLSPDSDGVEGSPAQAALMRVCERILELGGGQAEAQCRILAAAGHAGALMGKAGKRIKKMRADTGARIKVLPPALPSSTDEIVQIMGDPLAVKKAVLAVSHCLQEAFLSDLAQAPPRNVSVPVTQGAAVPHMEAGFPSPESSMLALNGQRHTSYPLTDQSNSRPIENLFSQEQQLLQREVKFRLLCYNDKIGGVIGKNGTIVKALEVETGASITCGGVVSESEERVITISALENPESPASPTRNAVIQVFCKTVEAIIKRENTDKVNSGPISTRLLISPNEVGCLMGKRGTIISELRIVTGAVFKIIRGSKVPKCATGNDEVLQISGEFQNVKVALLHATGRLRDNIFYAGPKNSIVMSYPSTAPVATSYYGSVVLPGQYASFAPPDFVCQTGLAHEMSHLGLSGADKCTTMHWKGKEVNGNSSVCTSDFEAKLSQSQKITGSESFVETRLEIEVPTHSVGSVCGKNGSNLSRIKQISGAEVAVHGQVEDKKLSVIVVTGTQDQTELAQSLVQAFILAAQNSAEPNSYNNSKNVES